MTRTKIDDGGWHEYATVRPEIAGVYEWLVPSRSCKGMIVHVLAHFRERGAGYSTVLSPEFDYWDGYRLHVPAGTKWRKAPDGTSLKPYTQKLLGIEGLEITPCPFCGKPPAVNGVQGAMSGGVIVSSDAHLYNRWWLECCSWAKTPRFNDPRELEASRRSMLSARSSGGASDAE